MFILNRDSVLVGKKIMQQTKTVENVVYLYFIAECIGMRLIQLFSDRSPTEWTHKKVRSQVHKTDGALAGVKGAPRPKWRMASGNVHQFGFFSPAVQVLISSYPRQQNDGKWEHKAILGNYPVDRRHIETSLAQPPNLAPLQPDRTEQLSMTE